MMPPLKDRNDALLVLNGLQRVGPVMLRNLLEVFGDPVKVLSASQSDLLQVKGVGDKAAEALVEWSSRFNLDKEKALMAKKGVRFISKEASDFPEMLSETFDPPIGLYWMGEYVIDRPCVAIVGTRRATLYGRTMAKKFAAELSRLGFCIVSGMARGTDTAAHEGALEAGGKTVAVLGCGLDIIYPPENLDIYKEIAAKGAVVSEFPFGRRADRQTFPMRNRVVAGMCQGVIVIESAASGGSMITARFAGEQGRSLMALPGRVDQTSSEGCHQLIRDGATLVTSVDDILEELRYARPEEAELDLDETGSKSRPDNLSEAESAVLDCFVGGELLSLDSIINQTNRAMAEVSSTVMGLELKRLLVKRGDGRYEAA
jgi:DNA processing protein